MIIIAGIGASGPAVAARAGRKSGGRRHLDGRSPRRASLCIVMWRPTPASVTSRLCRQGSEGTAGTCFTKYVVTGCGLTSNIHGEIQIPHTGPDEGVYL